MDATAANVPRADRGTVGAPIPLATKTIIFVGSYYNLDRPAQVFPEIGGSYFGALI